MPKKILFTGPESSGKTYLAQALATHFACPWVPEYAREYLNQLDRPYTAADLPLLLVGQLAQEQALADSAAPYLFCDTGPEVIYLWSQLKYGTVTPTITAALQEQQYDHRFLCYPDLVWESDPLREAPDAATRLVIWEAYVALHEHAGWAYTIISGQGEERLRTALDAVAAL